MLSASQVCRIASSFMVNKRMFVSQDFTAVTKVSASLIIAVLARINLLIECVDFNDVRQRFYQVPSLQDLFKTVKPEVILEFLKAAALYRLL